MVPKLKKKGATPIKLGVLDLKMAGGHLQYWVSEVIFGTNNIWMKIFIKVLMSGYAMMTLS